MLAKKIVGAVVLLLCCSGQALAEEDFTTFSTPRFTLHFETHRGTDVGESSFNKNIAEHSIKLLNDLSAEYSAVFRTQTSRQVVLRFLSPEEFSKQTGAPAWTSAMFYRGEISIPVLKKRGVNYTELSRALRHEYVHAVIAELSDYKSPAWLDEGVAQLLEGEANPLLGPALRKWSADNNAMPLEWLQNGFTTLSSNLVPTAYAQSLFVTKDLVKKHGYQGVVSYLKALKAESSPQQAFRFAFGIEQKDYEATLSGKIKDWAKSGLIHP